MGKIIYFRLLTSIFKQYIFLQSKISQKKIELKILSKQPTKNVHIYSEVHLLKNVQARKKNQSNLSWNHHCL